PSRSRNAKSSSGVAGTSLQFPTKLWQGRCFEKLQSTCRGMLVTPWRRNTPATTITTATESNAAFPAARSLSSGAAAAAARTGAGKGTMWEKFDGDGAAMPYRRDMPPRQYTMSGEIERFPSPGALPFRLRGLPWPAGFGIGAFGSVSLPTLSDAGVAQG